MESIYYIGLDVTGGHSPSVKGDDLVIETAETALTFRENERFEAGITVTGNGNIEVA